MRVLALDIGERRIGIAFGDTRTGIASPLVVLPAEEVTSNARTFRRVLEDYVPVVLDAGRPLTLSGEEGPQATHIEQVARQIAAAVGLPLEFQDERLSSREAKRILREQGLNERTMRGRVDSVAASLFLEAWMNSDQAQRGE